jgi:ribosomal protein S18 acetylase RimI-like enzyme
MIYDDFSIPPLTQTLENLQSEFKRKTILIATANGRIVGSVRAYQINHTCYVERLAVHPDFQKRGIGKRLMNQIEQDFGSANRFELFTGHKSEKNIRLYSKLGYKIFKQEVVMDRLSFVFMEKRPA